MPRASLSDDDENAVYPTARQTDMLLSITSRAAAPRHGSTRIREDDQKAHNMEACYECNSENARVNDSIVFCENCGYG